MNPLLRFGTYRYSFVPIALFTAILCTGTAFASLGGDVSSVQVDAAHMKATVKVQQMEAYALHEITDGNKVVVREYVGKDGRVFGVAWQGPYMPDLSKLLGPYLQQYSAGVAEQHSKFHGRRPLSLHQPGLVVEMSGHIRAYYGRAYVPGLVPQGIETGEVR